MAGVSHQRPALKNILKRYTVTHNNAFKEEIEAT
jgi:hypothetical protein